MTPGRSGFIVGLAIGISVVAATLVNGKEGVVVLLAAGGLLALFTWVRETVSLRRCENDDEAMRTFFGLAFGTGIGMMVPILCLVPPRMDFNIICVFWLAAMAVFHVAFLKPDWWRRWRRTAMAA